MREELIELIRKADKEDYKSKTQDEHYAFMADYLIANDVVPVVRCKDCKMEYGCRVAQWLGENGFCSYGERKDT